MVALDGRDGAARPQDGTQRGKRRGGVRQVFQHEAEEDVIEGGRRERSG